MIDYLRRTCHHLLLVGVILSTAACQLRLFSGGDSQNKLRSAEELTRQGKFDEAIVAYESHIGERAALHERPEWENPSFYYLLIGDLELRRENLDGALSRYLEADRDGVDSGLVSDRIRGIGSWLAERNRLPEAIKLLSQHRSRDPLLFDAMLDRFAKALSALEDLPTPTPTL